MTKISEYKITFYKSCVFNILAGLIFLTGYLTLLLILLKSGSTGLKQDIVDNYNLPLTFLTVIIAAFLHELMHAAAYKFFGGKVRFGIKMLNPYTADISGFYYDKRQMSIIILFPFLLNFLFAAFGLLIPQLIYYAAIALLFNISGSVGDICMVMHIITKEKNIRVRDEEFGFSIYK